MLGRGTMPRPEKSDGQVICQSTTVRDQGMRPAKRFCAPIVLCYPARVDLCRWRRISSGSRRWRSAVGWPGRASGCASG